MYCPTCQAVMRVDGALCPTCGDPLHAIRTTDAVEVVEGSAIYADGQAPGATEDMTLTIREAMGTHLVARGKTQDSLLARIPELSLLAWQQPAVRSAIKTGAGAIMLSLAMRVARQWLLEPRRRRAVTDSIMPAMGELLRPGEGPHRHGPGGGAEVIETFIYVRRTPRQ